MVVKVNAYCSKANYLLSSLLFINFYVLKKGNTNFFENHFAKTRKDD